jgi:hypothetical protein
VPKKNQIDSGQSVAPNFIKVLGWSVASAARIADTKVSAVSTRLFLATNTITATGKFAFC